MYSKSYRLHFTSNMPNTGRPSRNCHSCRQRRIKVDPYSSSFCSVVPLIMKFETKKCDLVRPGCGQCLRKGQRCPGYRDEEDTRFNIQTSYTFEQYLSRDQRKTYSLEYRTGVVGNNVDSDADISRNLEIRRSFQSSNMFDFHSFLPVGPAH